MPIAEISSRIQTNPHERYVVIGDLNARFGGQQDDFMKDKVMPKPTQYLASPDPATTANANARCIVGSLQPLVLVNNLKYGDQEFVSALTYRQGPRWFSELDHFLVSPAIVEQVHSFRDEIRVHQEPKLPSDHAPISVILSLKGAMASVEAASELAASAAAIGSRDLRSSSEALRRPNRMSDIDSDKARNALREVPPPQLTPGDVNATAEEISRILYSRAKDSHIDHQRDFPDRPSSNNQAHMRWKTLIEGDDHRLLWKAIGWNGSFTGSQAQESPTDAAFKEHFEQLLNPTETPDMVIPSPDTGHPYIPITDDPVEPREVEEAVRSLKSDKSGGPSGIPPGIIKFLPASWIMFIATFFSQILVDRHYPDIWRLTKLITLFKKGAKTICENYWGISLMDSMGKLYDIVRSRRLARWWKPDREQAGA